MTQACAQRECSQNSERDARERSPTGRTFRGERREKENEPFPCLFAKNLTFSRFTPSFCSRTASHLCT